MAVIRHMKLLSQGSERPQPECAAAIVPLEIAGERFLQINSYGSTDRVHVGARSQNMRLTKEAYDQLVELGRKHFGEK
ncbi:hypothetical protein [Sphingomonas sp. SORGH_AS_0879]|uniref:hypothetical protein n=1 Tax=Sphingomonas sp. SORGH_AS_0879 TaxID=3041790 RepID=UPI002781980F|nr:hypothetical protein [Sphingomonas sp. SORGH_AS_0879]MDQ1230265.1 hypothetical protein [Sphingomonas sp. SORGH_AS_0879]